MSKSFRDILSKNIPLPGVRPPVQVLNDLASALDAQVKFSFEFLVDTSTGENRAYHTLTARVSKLDKYVLQLLTASHDVLALYPVKLNGLLFPKPVEAATEDELVQALTDAITSSKASEILGTLLAQAV
jgi:hypothetical protein